MDKTTIYLDGADYRRLKAIARTKGRKPAELVREAVAEYTARHGGRRRLPKSVGAFSSGKRDLGTRADRYLSRFGEKR